jgi:hypothetical protein
MATRIPAISDGSTLRDGRSYGLTADDIGQWAVIQIGQIGLAVEQTPAAAMTAADVDETDVVPGPWGQDGELVVVEVREAWIGAVGGPFGVIYDTEAEAKGAEAEE